jgi:hypothetical protein
MMRGNELDWKIVLPRLQQYILNNVYLIVRTCRQKEKKTKNKKNART